MTLPFWARSMRARGVAEPPPPSTVEPYTFESLTGGTIRNDSTLTWFGVGLPSNDAQIIADTSLPGATHIIRVPYPVGGAGDYVFKYRLGVQVPEIWVEWYVRWDTTFDYTAESPNKLAQLYRFDGRNGETRCTLEHWRNSTSAPRIARGRPIVTLGTNTFPNSVQPGGTYANGTQDMLGVGRLAVPGEWVRMRWYVKHASDENALDGRFMWWVNNTLYFDATPTNIFPPRAWGSTEPALFGGGYFAGFNNNEFTNGLNLDFGLFKWYTTNPGWE